MTNFIQDFLDNTDIPREERESTCSSCLSNKECEFAFDLYNTDGDCLAIK